jgi:hypothetical protein
MPEALFGLVVVLVVAALLAAVVRLGVGLADSAAARRAARQRVASRWAVVHHADPHGGTVVCVALLSPEGVELDRRPVRRLDDADPGFDEAFLEAVLTAQARAALFQSAAGASLPGG